MAEKYILFDLDGTLSDSAPGITKSVAYALEKFGFVRDYRELGYFVGPPLSEVFMSKYGMSEEESDRAIKLFRERFEKTGIFENTAYDGIGEMLLKLSKSGKKLILATSKPEKYAKLIVERYGFTNYFHFIGGATMDEKVRTKKDEVISYCLSECNISKDDECIMVGDRMHDVEGAAKFGINTVGVLYGYGTREELEKAGACHICETVSDLTEFLLDW